MINTEDEICFVYIFSIRTSNIQRTIDSARCVVAGMFGKEQLKGAFCLSFMNIQSYFSHPSWAFQIKMVHMNVVPHSTMNTNGGTEN